VLRIATYNVLADAYIRPGYFPNTPPEVLVPGRRRPALLERFEALGADLLCLQEVEEELFRAAQERFPSWEGRYLPKGRGKPDGCAIFSRGRVSLTDAPSLAYGDGSGHVALSVRVEQGQRSLVVTTTHLKWAPPERGPDEHQGCLQLCELLAARETLCGGASEWLVCGDLNATPEHALLAMAADAGLRPAHAEDPPTCNVKGWCRTLDYLLVSENLRALPEAPPVLTATEPMPSARHPSDHLPLVTGLEWR
jgi:mRNA deadenylase 3'-5' endonuclease subunit Ccr4